MGQILAFVSGKGGTGKTSVCAAVASCLAAEGQQVLCIDCDLGLRNLDIALGMTDAATIPFTHLMLEYSELYDIPKHDGIPNLSLLTAPVSSSAQTFSSGEFRDFLNELRVRYDYCLIDAPAGIGETFSAVCDAADRIFVVSGSDPASLRDAASVSALLSSRPSGAVKLIINRVSPKMIRSMKITLDDVMDLTGLPLLGIVPEDKAIPLAATEGTPLILYTGKGAARACLNIARRIQGQRVPLMRL